jgi:hypothetical protein
MIWQKDVDLDGSLRYLLRREPWLLPLCVLTRYSRSMWNMVYADGIVNVQGSLKEVKRKAEGMLGL